MVTDSSFAYESCPHFYDQCDSGSVLKKNVWGNLSAELSDIEQSQFHINKPLDILVSDDSSWVGLNVDSKNSTVCSYRFVNDNSVSNVYQIKISDYKNLDIGIYFYSEFWGQVIDYKIFDAAMCNQIKYCQIQRDMSESAPNQNIMIFSIDDSKFTSLNLIPKSFSQEMTALVQYRLVNKME